MFIFQAAISTLHVAQPLPQLESKQLGSTITSTTFVDRNGQQITITKYQDSHGVEHIQEDFILPPYDEFFTTRRPTPLTPAPISAPVTVQTLQASRPNAIPTDAPKVNRKEGAYVHDNSGAYKPDNRGQYKGN